MLWDIGVALIAIAVWIEFEEWQPDKANWVRRKFQAVNDAVASWIWCRG